MDVSIEQKSNEKVAIMEPLAIVKNDFAPTLELTDLLEEVEENPMAVLFGGTDADVVGTVDETNGVVCNPAEESLSSGVGVTDVGNSLQASSSHTVSSSNTTIAKADGGLLSGRSDGL